MVLKKGPKGHKHILYLLALAIVDKRQRPAIRYSILVARCAALFKSFKELD